METTLEAIQIYDSLSEIEPMQSELLDGLMEAFYTPVDMTQVIHEVSQNVFIMLAVILAVFPFMYLLKRLVRYCATAFDTAFVRKMESGGLFGHLPDGSLYESMEKIAQIPAFKKLLRR